MYHNRQPKTNNTTIWSGGLYKTIDNDWSSVYGSGHYLSLKKPVSNFELWVSDDLRVIGIETDFYSKFWNIARSKGFPLGEMNTTNYILHKEAAVDAICVQDDLFLVFTQDKIHRLNYDEV